MKHLIPVALLALTLTACGKREEESEVVPPGFCKAEAQCQPTADRQNQTQEQLRQDLIAQGFTNNICRAGSTKRPKHRTAFGRSRVTPPDALRPRANKTRIPSFGKAKKSPH